MTSGRKTLLDIMNDCFICHSRLHLSNLTDFLGPMMWVSVKTMIRVRLLRVGFFPAAGSGQPWQIEWNVQMQQPYSHQSRQMKQSTMVSIITVSVFLIVQILETTQMTLWSTMIQRAQSEFQLKQTVKPKANDGSMVDQRSCGSDWDSNMIIFDVVEMSVLKSECLSQ